jgi:L-alanine-DL-glutamate epimerase-like enolase superfamily enzyme
MLEFLYIEPKSWVGIDSPVPQGGMVAIPEGPGLGFEPDPVALERFIVR